MRRLILVLAGLGGLAAFGGGCGKDCKSACSKLYDECKLSLIDTSGAQVSKDTCVTLCNQNKDKDAIVKCIHDAPCDVTKMGSCVQ